MKLSLHTVIAAVMLATGLVFSFGGSAYAQRATYRTVSGHGYGHGCPCPADCPRADGAPAAEEGAAEEGADDMGEDLPEVADLTSDSGFASADQSAAPNAIGDSNFPGYNINFLGGAYNVDPSGGRRYKISHNDSAVPQTRAFFNYNYYNNAQRSSFGGVTQEIDVQQYEVGGEYAFWCNSASIQVRAPFVDTFGSDISAFPVGTDTQFGNLQVALKAVVYQDCCSIFSVGTGLDLPTADDVNFLIGPVTALQVENEALLLSPYLAGLKYLDDCTFVHGFAQVSLPLEGNSVNGIGGVNLGEIDLPTLLYLDLSVGKWVTQDCCGNGVIAIAELHYTNALNDDAVAGVAVGDYELLNATIGAAVVNNCWTVTPALVLPLFDETDRAFDYEIAVYVNRRF